MRAFAIILLLTVPALAQQQPAISPSQMALQINAAIAQMATALEVALERNKVLETENEQLKKVKPK